MQDFWHVTIKYVNMRVIYTLNTVVHSRTRSNIYIPELWFLIGPEDG